jgi:hypothetical protein
MSHDLVFQVSTSLSTVSAPAVSYTLTQRRVTPVRAPTSAGTAETGFRGGQARCEHHHAAHRDIAPHIRTTSGGCGVGHEVGALRASISHRDDTRCPDWNTGAGDQVSLSARCSPPRSRWRHSAHATCLPVLRACTRRLVAPLTCAGETAGEGLCNQASLAGRPLRPGGEPSQRRSAISSTMQRII